MKNTKATQIGLERIYRLFELAEHEMAEHPARSRRYVHLALEISKKSRARIPGEMKTKFCKKCGAYLGTHNSEVTKEAAVTIVKCRECGFIRKMGQKGLAGK